MSRPNAAIRRVASSPFVPGIDRSMTTMSGFSARDRSTASSPVDASPTTSKRGSDSSNAANPARNMAWSSARTMRIGSPMRGFLGGYWNLDDDARPASRLTVDLDAAADG